MIEQIVINKKIINNSLINLNDIINNLLFIIIKNKDLDKHMNKHLLILKNIDKEIIIKTLNDLLDNDQILFIEYLAYYNIISEI